MLHCSETIMNLLNSNKEKTEVIRSENIESVFQIVETEKFALYGFEVEIPVDWRVEFNPKSTREKGDVVFQTQKGNRFFVSWGKLEDASKRFKTLEEHRDSSIEQVRKGTDVKTMKVTDFKEVQICGHRALISHVSAQVQTGMMSRKLTERNFWAMHLHCPSMSRYYVLFDTERDPEEFEDIGQVFDAFARSVVCHKQITTSF